MAKLSLIVCHVPLNDYLDSLLNDCLASLSGYDELVMVINDSIGYGKAHNRGFKYAKGDYFLCASNDTVLFKGDIKKMMKPGVVTYSQNAQWGCFFCMPREVYEKVGGFDERFEGAYFEDNEMLDRLAANKIPVERVVGVLVQHLGGQTVKALGKEAEWTAKNSAVYEELKNENRNNN